MSVQLRFCKAYVSRGFSATDPLTFGKPISLTVVPKDVPNTPPTLSIVHTIEGKGSDICLAAGFFPRDKKMILNDDNDKSLNTSNAALFPASKTYYYAGFNKESIQKCKMDETIIEKEGAKTPDSPVTANPSEKKNVPLSCQPSSSVSANTGGPKMNSMTLLMTGMRILFAKCVAVNVLMSVKAFIV
ncbi:uncharacterized protein LOC130554997 isoform X1 [Triplophysa rosa]|uniref:uncharacterized protein LOC130554997 isoform X1 n=1 Tax=Triplophysa rosa TaxID=992332 RepID=UPI00254625C1|nr:uncharacterized protein LOC130554997 isoform X1 [Triplophysa rosa]